MKAAAENLVPITLELGGKSPVILGRSADLATAAARVMDGKTLNAGQICLAPDYVLAPADKIGGFVDGGEIRGRAHVPDHQGQSRLHRRDRRPALRAAQGYIDDARAKGAEIVEINPAGEDFASSRTARSRRP